MSIETLLSAFPKTRPVLPAEYQAIFEEEYKSNREGTNLMSAAAQKAESWMHKKVAQKGKENESVLEIGAGTLNQVKYEKKFATYDIIEPFENLYKGQDNLSKVRNVYSDIKDIKSDDQSYDRIISVAVLEHLVELPYSLARSVILLNKGGIFQAGLPSEGGFLWGLGWRMTTGLGYYLRNKLSYKVLMEHEHINNIDEILAIVKYFFTEVTVQRFPLPGKHFSLYTYVEAKGPDLKRAKAYLETYTAHIDGPQHV